MQLLSNPSISDHTVIVFPVKDTYYGISLAPIIREYEINEDDIFIPLKEEMTVGELTSWIRVKEISFRQDIITIFSSYTNRDFVMKSCEWYNKILLKRGD